MQGRPRMWYTSGHGILSCMILLHGSSSCMVLPSAGYSHAWHTPCIVHPCVWYSIVHGTLTLMKGIPSFMACSHVWYTFCILNLSHKFVYGIPSCKVLHPAWYTLMHGRPLLWHTFVTSLCVVCHLVWYSLLPGKLSCMVHPFCGIPLSQVSV